MSVSPQQLRAYVDYLRDMGVYDLYRQDEPRIALPEGFLNDVERVAAAPAKPAAARVVAAPPIAAKPSPFAAAQARALPQTQAPRPVERAVVELPIDLQVPMAKPVSFDALVPLPGVRLPASE